MDMSIKVNSLGTKTSPNNMRNPIYYYFLWIILYLQVGPVFSQQPSFPWPEGKKMALSLSFDDARASNPELGIPILNKHGIKATFFVLPSGVRNNLSGWKAAVENGHEMANHSSIHPCSGNFVWSRDKALEDFTLERMRDELMKANHEIDELLGVTPEVFAYPCGQKFIGRGIHTQSYVPMIADLFLAGRGWMDEAPVDPRYADMSQLTGMKMDDMDFDEILPVLRDAADKGFWVVLAGHDTGEEGPQTTKLTFLEDLANYVNDPENGIWVAPIGEISRYVKETRASISDTTNMPELVRAQPDGELRLTAENGKGIGPKITYMPEWQAFGWFTGKDSVVWQVDVPKAGEYEVWLEWSVSDEEAGKEFLLLFGDQELSGAVEVSGSWDTFKEKRLGTLQLNAGYGKLVFKSARDFGEKGALLDLKKIRLKPI